MTAELWVLQAYMNITLPVSDTDREHNPTFHVTSESRDTAVIYHMSQRHQQNCVHSHVECADMNPGVILRTRKHAAGERPSTNDPKQARLSEEDRHC